jgi:hypothetical protein
MQQVLKMLRQKCAFTSGLSPAQAAEQLGHLQRLLPEWIRQEGVQGQHLLQLRTVQQLRISRSVSAGSMRAKLRAEVSAALAALTADEDGVVCTVALPPAAEAAKQAAVAMRRIPVRHTPVSLGKLRTDGIVALDGGSTRHTAHVNGRAMPCVSDDALALLQ